MQIHISPRDIKLTSAIHAYVAQKIESLEHFGLNLIGAHVALWHDDKRAFKHAFVVKVHLALPGPDIHAEDRGHDLYQAIDMVAGKLAEQLRHRKSKIGEGDAREEPQGEAEAAAANGAGVSLSGEDSTCGKLPLDKTRGGAVKSMPI